eukprot:1151102-Rhodomonas_salina.2
MGASREGGPPNQGQKAVFAAHVVPGMTESEARRPCSETMRPEVYNVAVDALPWELLLHARS